MLGIRIGKARGAERPMRFYEAALFQWVNPKAWAMAVSFVAAFVPPGEGHMLSLLLVSIGCGLISPLSTGTWMVFGKGLIAFLKRTGTERFLGWILASLMLVAVILFVM